MNGKLVPALWVAHEALVRLERYCPRVCAALAHTRASVDLSALEAHGGIPRGTELTLRNKAGSEATLTFKSYQASCDFGCIEAIKNSADFGQAAYRIIDPLMQTLGTQLEHLLSDFPTLENIYFVSAVPIDLEYATPYSATDTRNGLSLRAAAIWSPTLNFIPLRFDVLVGCAESGK